MDQPIFIKQSKHYMFSTVHLHHKIFNVSHKIPGVTQTDTC